MTKQLTVIIALLLVVAPVSPGERNFWLTTDHIISSPCYNKAQLYCGIAMILSKYKFNLKGDINVNKN